MRPRRERHDTTTAGQVGRPPILDGRPQETGDPPVLAASRGSWAEYITDAGTAPACSCPRFQPVRRSEMRRAVLLVLLVAGGVRGGLAQPAPFHVVEATIDDVRSALTSRRITCRALVEQYLKRIDAYDKSGPALNAVQTANASALRDAERLDAQFASSGPVGPLHCIPMLVKDQVEMRGMPTMYGSVIFKDFVSAAGRHGRGSAQEGRGGHRRQGHHGRVRVRLRRIGVRRCTQCLRPDAGSERVVRRHRRGRRRELRDRRHRRGHRRLDPRSRGRAQPGRAAAHASAGQPLRHDASPADHRTRSAPSRAL